MPRLWGLMTRVSSHLRRSRERIRRWIPSTGVCHFTMDVPFTRPLRTGRPPSARDPTSPSDPRSTPCARGRIDCLVMTTTRTSTAALGITPSVTARAASRVALHLDYLSSEEIASQSPAWWQNVLGVVGFEKPPAIDGAQVPVTASMTPSLGVNRNLCDVWRVSGEEVRMSNGAAKRSRVHYRFCEELLFGSITIEERSIEAEGPAGGGADGDSGALVRATELAVQGIVSVVQENEHRDLIRLCHSLPDTNREAGGGERYRLFNSARQLAFPNSGQAIVGTVPAACALGSPAGRPISIYFLPSRQQPEMIENPRQTSAYHYPPKFV